MESLRSPFSLPPPRFDDNDDRRRLSALGQHKVGSVDVEAGREEACNSCPAAAASSASALALSVL